MAIPKIYQVQGRLLSYATASGYSPLTAKQALLIFEHDGHKFERKASAKGIGNTTTCVAFEEPGLGTLVVYRNNAGGFYVNTEGVGHSAPNVLRDFMRSARLVPFPQADDTTPGIIHSQVAAIGEFETKFFAVYGKSPPVVKKSMVNAAYRAAIKTRTEQTMADHVPVTGLTPSMFYGGQPIDLDRFRIVVVNDHFASRMRVSERELEDRLRDVSPVGTVAIVSAKANGGPNLYELKGTAIVDKKKEAVALEAIARANGVGQRRNFHATDVPAVLKRRFSLGFDQQS